MSQIYSIYEAKAKFSEVVRKAKKGKEIVVSERGVPVIRIIALHPPYEETSLEKHLQDLRNQGLLMPAKSRRWPDSPPGDFRPGALKRFLKERG